MIDEKKMIAEGFKFKGLLSLQQDKGEPYILDLYFNVYPTSTELAIIASNNKAVIKGVQIFELSKTDTDELYYKVISTSGEKIG